MIYLFYTNFDKQLTLAQFKLMMQQLPATIQNKMSRFRNWQDAQRGLLGNMLLLNALRYFKLDYSLAELRYTEFNRPYFNGIVDFNISPSGAYVVCGFSLDDKLGVDIELIKNVPLQEMRSQFSSQEWLEIVGSSNKLRAFYTHWTRKESFLKAVGLGLSYSPDKVNFVNNAISWKGESWYCREITLDPTYACHIVCNKKDSELVIQKVYFE